MELTRYSDYDSVGLCLIVDKLGIMIRFGFWIFCLTWFGSLDSDKDAATLTDYDDNDGMME